MTHVVKNIIPEMLWFAIHALSETRRQLIVSVIAIEGKVCHDRLKEMLASAYEGEDMDEDIKTLIDAYIIEKVDRCYSLTDFGRRLIENLLKAVIE